MMIKRRYIHHKMIDPCGTSETVLSSITRYSLLEPYFLHGWMECPKFVTILSKVVEMLPMVPMVFIDF